MAIIETATDQQKLLDAKKRLRTINYRGSLLNISFTAGSFPFNSFPFNEESSVETWKEGSAGSVLYLFPVRFTTSIKKLAIMFDGTVADSGPDLCFGLHAYGIESDNKRTKLTKDPLSTFSNSTAHYTKAWVELSLWSLDKTFSAIYELIASQGSETKAKVDEYIKGYSGKDSTKCMLGLETTTKAIDANNISCMFLTCDFVEGNPSDMPTGKMSADEKISYL